jgi:hypothetical protein
MATGYEHVQRTQQTRGVDPCLNFMNTVMNLVVSLKQRIYF